MSAVLEQIEELARRLKINGYDCEFIMGDLPQAKRLEVIERLKAGEVKMLVATDVAARGLDVDALDRPPALGDNLSFTPTYAATLQLFTSPYVHKVFTPPA